MKKTTTEVFGGNLSVSCPNCKNWEEQPIDQQRHHLQTFEQTNFLGYSEMGNEVVVMNCTDCKTPFHLEWDFNNDSSYKAANAIKWIDGLSNTRYKQGREQLGSQSLGFCCLGYGCQLLEVDYAINDGVSRDFKSRVGLLYSQGMFTNEDKFRNDSKLSPSSEWEWGNGIGVQNLTGLNDQLGYSFNKISKFIKANIERLFEYDVAKLLKSHYDVSN